MSLLNDLSATATQRLADLESAVFGGPNPAGGNAKTVPVFYTGTADAIAYPGLAVLNGSAADTGATLATPVSGVDDGKQLLIIDGSGQAHEVTTAANVLVAGAAGAYLHALFNGDVGASILLVAVSGKWVVVASTGITLS